MTKQIRIPDGLKHPWARYARHEAGHFVAARALGFEAGPINMVISNMARTDVGGAAASIVLRASTSDIEGLLSYCRRRVAVLYAGAMAEALTNGKPDASKATVAWKTTAASDKEKASELVHIIRNIRFPERTSPEKEQEQLNQIDNELFTLAEEIVLKNTEVIERIGAALFSKVQIVGVEATLSSAELEAFEVVSMVPVKPTNTSEGDEGN